MNELINLDRYPLDRLDTSTGRQLVAKCVGDLDAVGMFTLTGFMRAAAIAEILPELTARSEREAFRHAREHNIYFDDDIDDIAQDHPALSRIQTINHTLCGDQLAPALTRIYHWPALAEFLAQVMGKSMLYPMADPLAGANVMSYHQGEGLNWHFDRSEFTTTLLLQAPLHGGEFQYRRALRSSENPNYEGVARLLRGDDPEVASLRLNAGDLNVFKGVDTAHRVTPPRGDKPRMVTVFTYYETPGRMFSDAENIGFYGRSNSS